MRSYIAHCKISKINHCQYHTKLTNNWVSPSYNFKNQNLIGSVFCNTLQGACAANVVNIAGKVFLGSFPEKSSANK